MFHSSVWFTVLDQRNEHHGSFVPCLQVGDAVPPSWAKATECLRGWRSEHITGVLRVVSLFCFNMYFVSLNLNHFFTVLCHRFLGGSFISVFFFLSLFPFFSLSLFYFLFLFFYVFFVHCVNGLSLHFTYFLFTIFLLIFLMTPCWRWQCELSDFLFVSLGKIKPLWVHTCSATDPPHALSPSALFVQAPQRCRPPHRVT